jgi:hypothetical protein
MLNKNGALRACALMAALMAAPATSEAAVVIYSAYDTQATGPGNKPNSDAAHAAFAAAISALPQTFTTTFEGWAAGERPSYDLGGGGVLASLDPKGDPLTVRTSPLCPYSVCGGNTTTGGRTFLQLTSGGSLTFSFATPIQAFGAYFSGGQLPGLQLTFNDGTSQVVDVPGLQGATFVGFTDFGKQISQVTFNAGRDQMALDDITFSLATPSAVPEPSAWALMIGGFSIMGAALRARRRLALA